MLLLQQIYCRSVGDEEKIISFRNVIDLFKSAEWYALFTKSELCELFMTNGFHYFRRVNNMSYKRMVHGIVIDKYEWYEKSEE